MESNPCHIKSTKAPPHAYMDMAKQSFSAAVPSNILHRANEVWRTQHPNKFCVGSYKSPDPITYVIQQFGREVCFANGSSGLADAAISLLRCGPTPKLSPTISINDILHQTKTTACTTDTEAFRRLSEETSCTHTTTTEAGIANFSGLGPRDSITT